MEQNTDRMWWTIGAVVLGGILIAGFLFITSNNFTPKISEKMNALIKTTEPSNKINPNDAKWVQKGNYGTNGKFVVDKDGNAVIYAIDASKPIVFHNMAEENANLPDTLTTLTFPDKVQGDTNSSMDRAFTDTFDHTFTNLKTINNLDTNVDTSNVTDMSAMFCDSQLTSVGDLSQWNTSKVTYMGAMFEASQLTSVGDLSQWNTSNVTDMGLMFAGSNLTTVGDLSQWNTSKVTNMQDMFLGSKLTSVGDLSKWNTSNVTYMGNMFYGSQLTPPSWYRWDAGPGPGPM